ncbi:MAG: 4-hydroxyphenylacetate 3-hydroxylase N-terminal domain-containing protein [Pseudomonadota bacterium]
MGARTGEQYVAGLRDTREVWVAGTRVEDVTDYPPFAGSVAGIAAYFDWQHQNADVCLMEHGNSQTNVSHLIPRSDADLAKRHQALYRMSEYSMGMLGRTPDYVNVTFAGYAALPDIWAIDGNDQGADNLLAFQRECAERDLALTHSIVHPVLDRRLSEYQGANRALSLRKVDETPDSIVVSGARLLATLGPFADEIAVYPGTPVPDDEPEAAVCFSIPMNTPGLKVLCRDHYGSDGNLKDQPFSARFDEQDAFMIFDNVEVPKRRVFCNGSPTVYNTVRATGWIANIMQQTSIRAMVKLQFAYELCVKMAEATGQHERPDIVKLLGEVWTYHELTRAAVRGAQADAHRYGENAWFCEEGPFVALRPTMAGWMARVNEIIKTIGSHNLLATPSVSDFDDVSLRPHLARYLKGADNLDAEERSRIFRTAWDFVGSALGGRIELYERLYLASATRTYGIAHMWAQNNRSQDQLASFWQHADAIDPE